MTRSISTLLRSRRAEVTRFLKFCVVGTLGTAVDFGFFNLFHNLLGFHPVLANTLSITAAIVNNYMFSRFWVYPETRHRQGGRKFAQFVVVSLIAWALNTGILWSTEQWVFGEAGLLAPIVRPAAQALNVAHGVLSSNLAKAIATGMVLFWNFFANRYWTFRDVDQVSRAASQPTG